MKKRHDKIGIIFNDKAFNDIDRGFASFIAARCRDDSYETALAALLISYCTLKGDVCVSIPDISDNCLSSVLDTDDDSAGGIMLPDEKRWIKILGKSPAVGRPGDYRPMILDEKGRLYLYRYWKYEKELADSILSRLGNDSGTPSPEFIRGIDKFFPRAEGMGADWQRISAYMASIKSFSVICGGPGTGKTSTMARILLLFMEEARINGREMKTALTAPTGKAAARLRESVQDVLGSMEIPRETKDNAPFEAFTMHRLLGMASGPYGTKFSADNRLKHDIFVVDEASMADLPLLSRFFSLVPASSKVILLGDRDQLSSIEAGTVFGDICGPMNKFRYNRDFAGIVSESVKEIIPPDRIDRGGPLIADSIVILDKSFRFEEGSGIGEFTRAVRDGDADRAIDLLMGGKYGDVSFKKIKSHREIQPLLKGIIMERYTEHFDAESPIEGINVFFRFRILSAIRKGPFGVEYINGLAEKILVSSGHINKEGPWYHGRPLIINKNSYDLKLFNGDTGIIYADKNGKGISSAYFPDYEKGVRKIIPMKLPEHESVYAMTVHKSQGSEFDEVLLILPDRFSPLLTRELLYTAATRAKKRITLWADENIIRLMIDNQVKRSSGLRDRLWAVRQD